MEKRIITISREFGSGGRFIGEEVAKKLGIAYYDKDIIGQIAEQSGLSPEYIKENAELSPKKGLFAYAFAGRDITGKSIEDMVYEAQRKVILELAGKEPCVIVGRNADYVLKDRDDVLNVFIHGNMPEKVQRICKLYNVTEADAINMINDTDKRRRTNYNFYTEQKWGMAGNYTLSLNSSVLGYDMCQKIIMDCAKMIGITPEVFTFNGMLEVCPPTIFLPCIFLAYCTGILRTPSFKMITSTTMAIIIAKMITTARIAVAGAFPNTNCSNRLLRS